MWRGVFLATALWLAALASWAQDMGIEGVISKQIQAFEADDFARAFSFASPSIQRFFGDSQNFGSMVQQGYPMVIRPSRVEFLRLNELPGRSLQSVMVRDRDGVFYVLEYEMIPAGDGWKINGVRLVVPPAVGA